MGSFDNLPNFFWNIVFLVQQNKDIHADLKHLKEE